MRFSVVIILAVTACAMLIAAGCTGSSGTTPATPAAPAATAEPSVPAPATTTVAVTTTPAEIPSWNGTWSTTYSSYDTEYPEVITLTQIGSSVTGTYHNGLGTIDGTVQDRKITGTWNDSDDFGKYSGFFMFEKSADGTSFTGKWVSGSEGMDALETTTQYWNGVRA